VKVAVIKKIQKYILTYLKKLIKLFRDKIGNSEIPFVAGELKCYFDNMMLIINVNQYLEN
jgi:hypothetical protein